MTEGPAKESPISIILIAVVVLGTISLVIWDYREAHPDWSLLVALWVFGAFTVSILLHLRKMRRHSSNMSQEQDTEQDD
jgi:membrane protein YdbS with pleckstrin-like domain